MYEPLDRERVRCYACGHCCPIPEGALGVCKVRFNKGGRLYVPWGYVGGVQAGFKGSSQHVLAGVRVAVR